MSVPSTDLRSAQEHIKEKILSQAAGLIPDELYSGLIQSAMDSFFQKGYERDNPITGKRESLSPFEIMFLTELRVKLVEIVKTELNDQKYRETYDGFQMGAGSAVKEAFVENADKMMQAFLLNLMGATMQNSLSAMQHQLNSNGGQYR